jgi:uncharacterized protein (TIGR02996 family)
MTVTVDTELQGFRRKICEEPDDITHRLVFADWLDEKGDSDWAKLIRVQVEVGGEIFVNLDGWISAPDFKSSAAFNPLFRRWKSEFSCGYDVRNGLPYKLIAQYNYVERRHHSLFEWPIEGIRVTDAANHCYDYHNDIEYYYCAFWLPGGVGVDRNQSAQELNDQVGRVLVDYYRQQYNLPPLKRT